MTILWSGLSVGALYAVVALGYNIVFLASATFNFAQAQFVMVGTFIAYAGSESWDWPLPLTLLVGAAGGFIAGSIEEQTELALRNVEAVLKEAGSDLNRVLQMTIYVSDISLWGGVNAAYSRVMDANR